jgi:DnaK suppressor protein
MPSKKSVTKARKTTAAPRAAARKPAAKTEARRAPVPARRPSASRSVARPARRVAAKPVARAEPAKAAAVARPARSGGPARTAAPAARSPQATVEVAPRVLPKTADREDAEGADRTNLLAGPRNVKPYVPKRGEQYMGKQQLRHFQEILMNWKRDLMMEVDRTVTHMKDEAANFPDPNDRATQEEEFSLELRTRDRERKLIRKIDEALKRAEDGTYGYCLETGEEIGIKRLEARPVATLSLEAQERRERRERQYGDRDDRYR